MARKMTTKQFRALIKEEASKLHRRTLLENERKELMEELGSIRGNVNENDSELTRYATDKFGDFDNRDGYYDAHRQILKNRFSKDDLDLAYAMTRIVNSSVRKVIYDKIGVNRDLADKIVQIQDESEGSETDKHTKLYASLISKLIEGFRDIYSDKKLVELMFSQKIYGDAVVNSYQAANYVNDREFIANLVFSHEYGENWKNSTFNPKMVKYLNQENLNRMIRDYRRELELGNEDNYPYEEALRISGFEHEVHTIYPRKMD